MASVKLRNPDRYDDELPDLCMKCGERATAYWWKTFSWYPGWVVLLILVGVLPFIIVALILTKRMRVEVRFCDAHKNHWQKRNLIVFGSLFALIALGVFSLVLFNALGEKDLMGRTCIGLFFLSVAWLITSLFVLASAIRPAVITERHITLVGVSRVFADAYYEEDQRTFARDVERTVRERWRQDHGRPRLDDDRYREDDPETRRRSERFREEED
jgi:hypothetical protein